MTSGNDSATSGTTRTNENYELRMKAVDALMETFQHDPLCPKWFETYDDQLECPTCDLIARVRSNEKAKWTHVCPDNNCCHQSGDI